MIRSFVVGLPGGSAALAAFDLATSRLGLMLIAASLAWIGGYRSAAEKCDADNVRSELRSAKADLANAEAASKLARRQAEDLSRSDRANQDKINALTADLAGRPARNCGLSDADARRLLRIR